MAGRGVASHVERTVRNAGEHVKRTVRNAGEHVERTVRSAGERGNRTVPNRGEHGGPHRSSGLTPPRGRAESAKIKGFAVASRQRLPGG